MLLSGWRLAGLRGIAALLCLALPPCAPAQESSRFEVRNAFVELKDGVWQLNVRLDLALSKSARHAFEEGVPLELELEAEASVERRLLPDETVVAWSRKWRLAHDAIADRYVVTDTESGEQVSHATQDEALAAMARIVSLPFAAEGRLAPGERFDMRVRATVEIGELPSAIKMLIFWKSWSRSTDWYGWKVRP